jgi:hypothetical protein
MVEQVTFQTIFQFLQTVGILTAVFYYIMTLRNVERARQRETIFQRIQSFDLPYARAWGDVMFKDVSTPEKWYEAYDPNENPETWANMAFLQNRYQSLGVMLREKIVDPDLLFQMFNPGSIITAWEHYRDNILARRKSRNQPALFEGFEYLAEEARKRYPEITPFRAQWGYELN